ncbi:MAG TPA: MBOAT family O-acyltransferase [Candidatus Dormibacteraeota bacterium]|nr:MBOAT family O-acyltransferase [Candidatus Dormibacteraeota bacterium]
MLFTAEPYVLFLPSVVAVNWLLPASWRPAFLLAASYFFYAYWSWPYLFLIVSLTAFNYLVGLAQEKRKPRSRALLILAIVVDLGALGVFKYLGFFASSVNSLAQLVGGQGSLPVVSLVLPLGLSFFTFEFIHYQIDLLRGADPIRDPIRYALFPAFFPTQIAGPIKRYEDFDEQVRSRPAFNVALFWEGIELIALGLFKKIVISDNVARVVIVMFHNPSHLGMGDAWLGALAFWLQIYFDFSGYTDIARGSAQLFGYRIPFNFNAPYLARNMQNMWTRWHMSLSFWLRDYVFTPLVYSRTLKRFRGNLRLVIGVMVTMILCGLWHGAAGHFIVFGVMLGLTLILDRILELRVWRRKMPRRVKVIGVWAQTQILALITIVLFVVPMGTALAVWKSMLTGPPAFLVANPLEVIQVVGIYAATIGIQLALERWQLRELISRFEWSALVRPAYVTSLAAWSLYFAVVGSAFSLASQRFVYFQF